MSDAIVEIRSRSRRLALLSTAVLGVLVLALCVEAATIRLAEDRLTAVQYGLIYRSPFIFYLAAIWLMRGAFRSLSNGALFDDIVPALLRTTGYALSGGAIMTIMAVPLMLRLAFGQPAGGIANFDVSAIMLGIFGMMLVLLARLLLQASQMRAELEEFF